MSKFTGDQIDTAIENIRDYDAELALKADKSTTVNGQPLSGDVLITAEDIGALPNTIKYGASLSYGNGYLSLVDQDDSVIDDSSQFIWPSWIEIQGDDVYQNIVLKNALDEKQDVITSENMIGSDLVYDTDQEHKFATSAQLSQIVTNQSNIAINTENISIINGKIPSQATDQNQLADKNFVNSSIATNTSYFVGTFQSVEELEAYSGTLTNNDYAFVETRDQAGNTYYDRYKYNSNIQEWAFEYELNNSSFTAEQWATITSGLTKSDVTQIGTNKSNIATINSTLNGFGNIVTHNTSEFASSSQGTLASSALQPGDNITELSNNAGYITGINSNDVTTALGFTPYSSANPSGYITSSAIGNGVITFTQGGINKGSITTNQSGNATIALDGSGLTSVALDDLTDVTISSPVAGQNLVYDGDSGKWKNKTTTATIAWGGITGTLADQTDLSTALQGKSKVTFVDWTT